MHCSKRRVAASAHGRGAEFARAVQWLGRGRGCAGDHCGRCPPYRHTGGSWRKAPHQVGLEGVYTRLYEACGGSQMLHADRPANVLPRGAKAGTRRSELRRVPPWPTRCPAADTGRTKVVRLGAMSTAWAPLVRTNWITSTQTTRRTHSQQSSRRDAATDCRCSSPSSTAFGVRADSRLATRALLALQAGDIRASPGGQLVLHGLNALLAVVVTHRSALALSAGDPRPERRLRGLTERGDWKRIGLHPFRP